MQIVLARLEKDFEVVSTAGIDLRRAPVMREVPKAVAMMWLKRGGTEKDLSKAREFAEKEGYTVFTFSKERDPLGRAKAELLIAAAKGETNASN